MSSVPIIGTSLGQLSDLAFKAFGFTEVNLSGGVPPGTTISLDAKVTRLAARFLVYPCALLVGSKAGIIADNNRSVITPYCDGKVIHLTVTVRPTSQILDRQGEWTLAINPFFNVTDEGNLSTDEYPSESSLRKAYLSTTGPASQPLALTYRPRIVDGRAYQYNKLDTGFCEVVVMFSQTIRDNYVNFSAAEFAPEVLLSGSLEMRGADPGGRSHVRIVTTDGEIKDTKIGGYKYDYMVRDLLTNIRFVAGQVYKGEVRHLVFGHPSYSETPNVGGEGGGFLKIKGIIAKPTLRSDVDLDSFEELSVYSARSHN